MKIKYSSLLSVLVDYDVITEWQAYYLQCLFLFGSKDFSYYKLSKLIYCNLHESEVHNGKNEKNAECCK